MNIQIDEKSLIIAGQRFPYDAYYFEAEEYEHLSCPAILKAILAQWAEALANSDDRNASLFLPFSFDDEEVDCFRARVDGDKVVLSYAQVWENGYALNVADLNEFMRSEYQILEESPEILGAFTKRELISALLNAEVVAA